MYRLVWALGAVALFVVSGCGGGGGGTPAVPLSNTFRTMQIGDRYEYETSSATGTGAEYVYVGEYRFYLDAVDFTEHTALVEHLSGGGSNAYNSSLYVSQDQDGSCWIHGGQRPDYIGYHVNHPEDEKYLLYPGSWYQGLSWEQEVETSDFRTLEISAVVTGTQRIHVPAGTFETYRVTIVQTTSAEFPSIPFFTTERTMWTAPQIGASVRSVSVTTMYDGQILHHTSELRSYQLASP